MTDRTRLVLILALALGVRVGAGVWWQARLDKPFGFGDSESYWRLAGRVARWEPYEYGGPSAKVFRTPGYPIVLAPGIALFGDGMAGVRAARVCSAVLATASITGIYYLGNMLFGVRCGLGAALATALLPDAIGLGVFVLSEAPFCPLMMAQLALAIAAWRSEGTRRSVLLSLGAGVTAGLASLMRPSWLLFVPFAMIAGVLLSPDRRRHMTLGAASLAGLVLAMSPWWIRNAVVTGHFVPTSLQAGASLYDGWNPDADGSSNMLPQTLEYIRFASRKTQGDPPLSPAELSPAEFEYQFDGYLRDEALRWARANPGRVLQLAGIKFLRIWNIWPNEPSFRSLPLRLAVACTYVPLMLLAFYGAWHYRAMGWPIVLLILPAVYITCLHVVFVSSIRYRQPALLPLAVLAAAGAEALWTKWRPSSLAPSP